MIVFCVIGFSYVIVLCVSLLAQFGIVSKWIEDWVLRGQRMEVLLGELMWNLRQYFGMWN